MSKYVCRYGLYHNKQVKNGEPSSNNGLIYTATAKHLGKNISLTREMVNHLNVPKSKILYHDRLPNKPFPPMSHDEVIGEVCLSKVFAKNIHDRNYIFCNIDRVEQNTTIRGLLKALYSAYKIRNEHRNYFWQNKVTDLYPFAFRLSAANRRFVKLIINERPTLRERLSFYIDIVITLLGKDKSSKLLLWNKMKAIGSSSLVSTIVIKLLGDKKVIRNYFKADHDFNS